MSWRIKVDAYGWMLKLDPHGLAIVNVAQVAHDLGHHCDHDEELEPDPDFYRVHREALWSMLEDAAIEARNGATAIQAADAVFANLTLAATEAAAGDEQ